MNICTRCKKEFKVIKSSKSNLDGLCGKCRSRQVYLDNPNKYRKNNKCLSCGKSILNLSKYCYSCSQIGEKNHNWKGIKYDRTALSTNEWKNWRSNIFTRDSNKCKMCGEIKTLQAHHILPRRFDKRFTYDLENGITLCKKCHSKIHFKEIQYAELFLYLIQ